uniref:CCHC-type domain-containing protein n=1 Tax=Tanacetum cinerariifolium TaxID=118510 RepID=A0A6L2J713_TANCI|nr:hypothetical protein [Tanacetum cinerariifolium]
MSWRELIKLMAEVYCPRNEIQKMESELWNLTVKNNDLAAYTQRFQELTMMCTKMVPEEEDWVKKFIGGLPDNIQRNVIVTEPIRLQDDVRIANNLMDQKFKGHAVKNAESKRRLEVNQRDNRGGYTGPLPYRNKYKLHHEGPCTVKCGKCNKVGHMARDCKNAVVVLTTQRAPVVNQRVPICFKCERQGHYKNECPKIKNQNSGNKVREKTKEAREKAYVLGGGETNLDLNVVTDTFLLNNHYASMIFDLGADRSFMSGCTLGLLGHPFNIDLMPIELGSFDVIIGMDWLANHHAMALWQSQMKDHTSDWLRVVLISGLGHTMNACSKVFASDIYGDHVVSCADIIGIKHRHNVVCDTLVDICFWSGISAGKEVDIDLTWSSPLTHTGVVDFIPGYVVIDAAQSKHVMYEAKCVDIEYGFLPFSFSSLGELKNDAVTPLKRI